MLCEGHVDDGMSFTIWAQGGRRNVDQQRQKPCRVSSVCAALAWSLTARAGPGDAGRDDYGGGRERRRGYGFGEAGFDDERGGGGYGRERSRGGGFADSYGRDRGGGGSFADSYGRDRGGPGRDAPDAGARGYGFRCAARDCSSAALSWLCPCLCACWRAPSTEDSMPAKSAVSFSQAGAASMVVTPNPCP